MAERSYSLKLLLVDDDPSMVRLLTKILQRTFADRMELHAVTCPKEARSCIEGNIIDILVTDLEMPGVNGLELLRCAKRRNVCAQVLFVTGHSTLDALTDALELGATDYLLKPLDQAELVELISDAERRVRRWREALAGTLVASRENQTTAAEVLASQSANVSNLIGGDRQDGCTR